MKHALLSTQQLKAVNHVDGPILVIAGPGSGKTRVITERVRHLLSDVPGHFRVLALTFTNKAAAEMQDRLSDLGDDRQRAFIGTLHSFCSLMLAERGQSVGVFAIPQIFDQLQDRKQVLLQAVSQDPVLTEILEEAIDSKARNKTLDQWLEMISYVKTHPLSNVNLDDDVENRVYEAYNAGLRASGVFDFDDLLLLTYRLLNEQPQIADFYRRLYRFICIDEAQDLNEVQYAVIAALCGSELNNILMVGDPKQSIYGFNSSGPEFMFQFRDDFKAIELELTENFRSSQAVVRLAKSLEPKYEVAGQLPVKGSIELIEAENEADEAKLVVSQIMSLVKNGHPDIEGTIKLSNCAVLGRTRFSLLALEAELKSQNIPYLKKMSGSHQYESSVLTDFHRGLRVLANPKDRLHLVALTKNWLKIAPEIPNLESMTDVVDFLFEIKVEHDQDRIHMLVAALKSIVRGGDRNDLMPAFAIIQRYADALPHDSKSLIYEDVKVMEFEWDQYLRAEGLRASVAGFMSRISLGSGKEIESDGLALLTVHSSKGLEFDVVCIVGMAEGVFPDYRAQSTRNGKAEERRNAFVAVTRSRRLVLLSYPKSRMMPWGQEKAQIASSYLKEAGLLPL